jgi:hypothetical protein
MNWFIWGVLLIIQNASFTMVSRARNSGSLLYHGIASIFSNGIWFLSQFILVDKFMTILKGNDWKLAAITGLFYTACTIAGSLSMHYISMHYLEKGKRKVGG